MNKVSKAKKSCMHRTLINPLVLNIIHVLTPSVMPKTLNAINTAALMQPFSTAPAYHYEHLILAPKGYYVH
jgi:hypothetical protein